MIKLGEARMDGVFRYFLLIGTLLSIIVMLICRKWYPYAAWKIVFITILLTIVGVVGVVLLFFVETGEWGGLSHFGAVFLCPIFLVLISPLFQIPRKDLLDLCAPPACIMFALMKVNCYKDGCCFGRILMENEDGMIIRFPSQIAEGGCALILMVVLMLMMRNGENRGKILPLYFVFYGGSRFVLSFLRDASPFILGITIRGLWALITTVIGVIWLLVLRKIAAEKAKEVL